MQETAVIQSKLEQVEAEVIDYEEQRKMVETQINEEVERFSVSDQN